MIPANESLLVSGGDITESGLKWAASDSWDLPKVNIPEVVNTDRDNAPGVHWIVLIRVKAFPSIVLLIDPLGKSNNRQTTNNESADEIIKQRAKDLSFGHWIVEPMNFKVQSKSSIHCGQFSQVVACVLVKYLKQNPDIQPKKLIKLAADVLNYKQPEETLKTVFE